MSCMVCCIQDDSDLSPHICVQRGVQRKAYSQPHLHAFVLPLDVCEPWGNAVL